MARKNNATTTNATAIAVVEATPTTSKKDKTPKPPRFVAMDAAAAAAIAATARPAINPCLCGCGQTTKGRFFPGHDALLKERLKATIATGDDAAKASATAAVAIFGW